MEKHFPDKKTFSKSTPWDIGAYASMPRDRIMVYDFLQTCKTYDKNIYNRGYFKTTHCPACPAVGRFNMYGSYWRYTIYFDEDEIKRRLMEIKRIICLSCKTTHAVMPGDIIPYKMLSLFVFIFVLVLFYLRKTSVLKIAGVWDFSFQFIYAVMRSFQRHMNSIRQYIREVSPEDIPAVFDACAVLTLIKKPYIKFQLDFLKINRKPCFMCKFFNKRGAPPIGIHAPMRAAT